ncbi:DUF1818 family protein [Oscillatoria sp. CS-180]|uniref:DUF1818 family protein n=1 Tax=Oscillatoria sp. CS-180 TaxID=3021720 RepID=UPI00232F11B4|nr:DUF1818 family protein [Oscillatoria sp. CS-180]MDB9529117.1 DUF1818 family protein [Oscillatoria sp. CS-180]
MRHVKEGDGWRLGYDPDATVFKGLVGGDRWAVEMTQPEFQDFCRLTQQLAKTVQAIAAELMDEERITCEQETDHIWVEVEGLPADYSLRFILLQGRNVEGAWPNCVIPELMQAVASVGVL